MIDYRYLPCPCMLIYDHYSLLVVVFNYGSAAHNVVAVNKVGYQKCSTTPGNARVYQTGNDKIRLAKGQNFFICNVPGHCQSGMKVAITAV